MKESDKKIYDKFCENYDKLLYPPISKFIKIEKTCRPNAKKNKKNESKSSHKNFYDHL